MDKREKSIYEAGEMLLADRPEQNIVAIETAFQTAPEECSLTFFEALQTVQERAGAAQDKGDKGALRYIYISYLQSSLYTGSHKLRIDAYDERQFGDLTNTFAYWKPDFIFKHLDSDILYFREHIKKHVVRIREHEIMRFIHRYSAHYYLITQQLVAELIRPFLSQNVADAEEVIISFGGYMEQAVILNEKRDNS